MNISLHIEAGNPAELQEAIAGLAGITGDADKSKRTPKNSDKKEKQPDIIPEIEAEIESATENPSGYIPTVVELRAKAQEKGGTPEGKQAIKALLNKFGRKSITDVHEDERAAFLAALEAL